jgi:hypothetical protein
MKNWRTPIIVLITILTVYIIKFQLNFPSADIEVIGVILTISSILFGFLGGFFISELWSRYTEIRTLQSEWSSEGLNMLQYATHFFKNKEFERDFKNKMEQALTADQLVSWTELDMEIPYFRKIGDSFEKIKVKTSKDEVYFSDLTDSYNDFIKAVVKLDTLGKEKLLSSEWSILFVLSSIIAISILFLDISHIFYRIMVLVFPAIITLALSIIYNLNGLNWGRRTTTLAPNERLFDNMGIKRFYSKTELKYKDPKIKDYRTEEDLTGELKKIRDKIIEHRKKK